MVQVQKEYMSIEKYMLKDRQQRMSHLKLNDSCIEIGGKSILYKGLLAHFLMTTIPQGWYILLCHACHNGKCSNVEHLYWGNRSDNMIDAYNNGRKSIFECAVQKYGEKKARKMFSDRAKKIGHFGGGRNKMTSKDIENFRTILDQIDTSKFGWVKILADYFNKSHTQIRRLVNKYGNKDVYTRSLRSSIG